MSVRSKAKERAKQPYKTQYRVANLLTYNRSLIKRGSHDPWIDQEALSSQRRGGQLVYTDMAITCLLTLQATFHLPLRATQGMAHSLF